MRTPKVEEIDPIGAAANVIVSLKVRLAIPVPLCCVKMFGAGPLGGWATNEAGRIIPMLAFVFS